MKVIVEEIVEMEMLIRIGNSYEEFKTLMEKYTRDRWF
jgi:hypothetical protein